MQSFDGEYGFDDSFFLSETPEYLRCVVCSLVLRNAVQILTCGHKFCSLCFDRMKKYADNKNTELCCPIDRDIVDLSKVHEDVAMKRVVGNLTVRCGAYEEGCSWIGDLRELEKHNSKCSHQNQLQIGNMVTDEMDKIIRDLHDNVARCKSWMAEKDRKVVDKDKEIICLKQQIQQLKDELLTTKQNMQVEVDKNKQLDNLKHEMSELKETFVSLQAQNQEIETNEEITKHSNNSAVGVDSDSTDNFISTTGVDGGGGESPQDASSRGSPESGGVSVCPGGFGGSSLGNYKSSGGFNGGYKDKGGGYNGGFKKSGGGFNGGHKNKGGRFKSNSGGFGGGFKSNSGGFGGGFKSNSGGFGGGFKSSSGGFGGGFKNSGGGFKRSGGGYTGGYENSGGGFGNVSSGYGFGGGFGICGHGEGSGSSDEGF